jgi:hypothetical protein
MICPTIIEEVTPAMSGQGVGAELGRAVGETIAAHMALPPRLKNIHRAAMGAWLLVAVAYSIWWSRAFIGWPAGTLLTFFLQHPASAAAIVWLPLALWAGAGVLALLWLVVGISGARGPRDTMTIVWAAVRLGIVAALLGCGIYLPRDWHWPLVNLALRGFYLAYLAACAVELVLLMLGPPRRALQADAHGRARTATTEDLRRGGILR